MLQNLIHKDLKAFGKQISIATFFFLIMNNFFVHFDNNTWEPYFLISVGQISYIIAFYTILEKMKKGEFLICSLPITRTAIVLARFLTCTIIVVAGLFLIYFNAFLINIFSNSTPDNLGVFISPYVFFIFLSYFSLFVSIFIPIITYFKTFWANIILVGICLPAFIIGTDHLHKNIQSYQQGFETANFFLIFFLVLTMFFAPFLSFSLTRKIFSKKDV
jgi:hypothetical protein